MLDLRFSFDNQSLCLKPSHLTHYLLLQHMNWIYLNIYVLWMVQSLPRFIQLTHIYGAQHCHQFSKPASWLSHFLSQFFYKYSPIWAYELGIKHHIMNLQYSVQRTPVDCFLNPNILRKIARYKQLSLMAPMI